MMETIKTINLTPAQIRKRINLRNPQLMHDLYLQKKNIILVASHYGNWEWLMGLAGATPYHTLAVYKPLHNKRIDKIMKNLRSKAGTELVSMRWILKTLSNYNKENKLTFSLFVADQSPVREEAEYWTTFLNQDTAVFVGIEKLAIRYNHAVLFCYTRRIRRGYYEVELKPVSLDPSTTHTHEITNRHLQYLEELIREEPAFWLWSHRRWKLKKLPVDNSHAK
jgi:KDO2-lipid IV(A) lauroyltransferase